MASHDTRRGPDLGACAALHRQGGHSRPDGSVSLGRIGHIVEQLSELHLAGKDVMLVTSGAVGVGRGKLRKQQLFSRSVQSHINGSALEAPSLNACAAAGQSGVMGLYEQLFGQYDVLCAQILVSPADFVQEAKVAQLKTSLLWLLSHETIPVINENDAISSHCSAAHAAPDGRPPTLSFSDSDGLAAVLAQLLEADVLLLLSDVEGVYRAMLAPVHDGVVAVARATACAGGG
jgi:delta-1-pyrroline-5-carboxylate synthetase